MGVVNFTIDTTAPILTGTAVSGTRLVLTYTETGGGFADTVPATSSFAVSKNGGTAINVSNVAVDATAQTVTLTLETAITNADSNILLSYTPPGSDPIQDVAGNPAIALSNQSVSNDSPDTTAPAAPVLSLLPASDSGTSNSDGLTQVARPTVRVVLDGSGVYAPQAGDTVEVYDAGSLLGSTRLTDANISDGYVDYRTAVVLTGGLHTLTATITDAAGNTGIPSSLLNFTLDTTAPTLASATTNATRLVLTYTEADTEFAGTVPAASSFAVSKNGGTTVNVSNVAVDALNATVTLTLETAITNADSNILVSYLPPESNPIADVTGNTALAFSDQPVIDNSADTTAPEAPALSLLSAFDSGLSNSDGLTRVARPTVRVSLSGTGAYAPVAGDTVKIYDHGVLARTTALAAADIAQGHADYVTSIILAEGTHDVTATLTDAAGNTSSLSSLMRLVIDTTVAVPAILLASDDGRNTDDGITTAGLLDISQLEDGGRWEYSLDGGSTWTAGAGSTLSLTGDGIKSVSVRQTDAAGNTSAASPAYTFTLDTQIPDAPVMQGISDDVSPLSGTIANGGSTNDTRPTLVGTAEPGTRITVRDGNAIVGTILTDDAGHWSFTIPAKAALTEGIHSYTVTATDLAGNVSASGPAYSLTVDLTAPTLLSPPTLQPASDTGISNTDRYTAATTPVFDLALKDSGAVAGDTVTLYDQTAHAAPHKAGFSATGIDPILATVTLTAADIAADTVSIRVTAPMSDGVYDLATTLTDQAGNESGPLGLSITIDTVAPGAIADIALQAASDTGASNSDGYTASNRPVFDLSLRDTGVLTGDRVRLYDHTGKVLATTVLTADAIAANTLSISPEQALADGVYQFAVTVTDQAGNESGRLTLPVTLDTMPPQGTTIDGTNPTSVYGTVEAGSTVTLKIGNGDSRTATVTGTTWQYVFTQSELVGLKGATATAIQIQATDQAGNTARASGTIDGASLSPPTATGFVPVDGTTVANGPDNQPVLHIILSKPVVKGTGNIDLYQIDGTLVERIPVDGSQTSITGDQNRTITILPSQPLVTGTHYYLTADAGTFTDNNGLSFPGLIQTGTDGWDFTATAVAITPGRITDLDYLNDVQVSQAIPVSGLLKADTAILKSSSLPDFSIDVIPIGGSPIAVVLDSYDADTGRFTATVPANTFSDGRYLLAMRFNGTTGVAEGLSAEYDFDNLLIDRIAPTTTATLTILRDDHGGVTQMLALDGSAITDDTSPYLEGKVSASLVKGEYIMLYRNDLTTDTTETVTGQYGIQAVGKNWSWSDKGLEDGHRYSYTMRVLDAAGNASQPTTSAAFTVDATAPVFNSDGTAPSIQENSGANQIVYRARAEDSSPLSYRLADSGDASLLSIDSQTGVVTLLANPDYEQKSSYTFTVVALDPAGNSAVQSVTLNIGDIDEHTPLVVGLQTTTETTTPLPPGIDPIRDNVTRDANPDFTARLASGAKAGDNLQITYTDAAGNTIVLAEQTITASDLATGTVSFTSGTELGDGRYGLKANLRDTTGNITDQSDLDITVITDADGVLPSIESVVRNGDFNGDGIADASQFQVATLPLASDTAFAEGATASPDSFGSILIGNVASDNGGDSVQLDPGAQLSNIAVLSPTSLLQRYTDTQATALDTALTAIQTDPVMSGLLDFTVQPQAGVDALTDLDPNRPGLQTRVVVELPEGTTGNTYYKIGPTADNPEPQVYTYMADGNPATYDDGAELYDLNGDGLPDRLMITFTDGATGDDDLTANGRIVDPGFLGIKDDCHCDDDTTPNPGITLVGDTGADIHDKLTGTDGDDTLQGLLGADTLSGNAGNDSLEGGRKKDWLEGGDGKDTLLGGWGRDTVLGGDCEDSIDGGRGRDSLEGGQGTDELYGGEGWMRDTLHGGDCADTLDGGHARDILHGDAGNDALAGGPGRDRVYGGDGNDTLEEGNGSDFILDGGAGDDLILGGNGMDELQGGSGNDTLEGGAGRDIYRYAATAPGTDDLAVGTHDVIDDSDARNLIQFSPEINGILKLDGITLDTVVSRTPLAANLDTNNSIAYSAETASLLIDFDGNGTFEAATDMQIELSGVTQVKFAPEPAGLILIA